MTHAPAGRSSMFALALVLVLALVPVSPGTASCIIPNGAVDGSTCGTTATQGTPFDIYLLGTLFSDAAAPGITGAEFKLEGQDPTWIAIVTPNPAANLVFGDPVQHGCNIAFPSCQVGTGARAIVVLYTVQFIAFGPVQSQVLRITKHDTPSNPNFMCPLFTICDDPVFTKLCVPGGQECVNNPNPACCGDPVVPAAWSGVKALYQAGR